MKNTLKSLVRITQFLSLFDPPHQVQGTIFPAPNFNPVLDAELLGGALQGFGEPGDV